MPESAPLTALEAAPLVATVDFPAESPADPYDLVPYESHAYALSHPRRLDAVASLFGLNTPDPARARVLELGCAAGGNLIPIAALAPESECLWIELSQGQVDAEIDQFLSDHPAEPTTTRRRKT